MSDVALIGRAEQPESNYPSRSDIKKKGWLTLAEASAIMGLSIHKLKEAVQAGKLMAERRDRYEIKREELIGFMKASNMPYKIIFELAKATTRQLR
jgi:hypothetical protein